MKEIVKSAQTELVRWAHSPSIISPQLAAKEELNFWDKMWVYNSVVVAIIALLAAGLMVATFGNDSGAIPLVPEIANGVVLLISSFCSLIRVAGKDRPIDQETWELNYEGRKRLVLYDRNRRRAPWAKERAKRGREVDGHYPQLSVWAEPGKTSVQYSIIEHDKRHRFGPHNVKIFTYHGTLASKGVNAGDMNVLLEERANFEEIAHKAETEQYGEAVKEFQTKRDTLIIRR